MEIHVLSDSSPLPINRSSVEILVHEFVNFHKVRFDEASIYFVDTATICDLHDRFFDDPSPTDCISFPMDDSTDEDYCVMGDVFVCPEVAMDYIKVNGGDVYHELTLYVIHGLLHLIGFDDIDETDQQEMRAEESRYLKHVAGKNLWLIG
ncbi:MAG: rRNA maturation RNase YbeY [Parachlamydiaceae bacterium]